SRFVPEKWLNAAVEIVKVLIAVIAVFSAIWWLRYDAKIDERRAGNARCDKTITNLVNTQTNEADRRAEDAQSAGEAQPPVPAVRAELNRLCATDEACRERLAHGRRK
ncbi:MAG: hypothetical protein ABL893_15905, partial [Hyphomicrobium sp.]